MVNALNKNISSLPAGKYLKSTKQSTRQHHQANKGNFRLEAERVRTLGALRSLWSKEKLLVEKRWDKQFLNNTEKVKYIENYVDRETTVARTRVQDAEIVIMREQDDMKNVEKAQSTTTMPETTFEETLNAIWDYLRDVANSGDGEDGDDEDDDEEDTELHNLNEDDEPGWVMCKISKTVQHNMESFQQMKMTLDELTQAESGQVTDYLCERDMNYRRTELKVLAVGKP